MSLILRSALASTFILLLFIVTAEMAAGKSKKVGKVSTVTCDCACRKKNADGSTTSLGDNTNGHRF